MYGLNNSKMGAHVQMPMREAQNITLNLEHMARTPQLKTLKAGPSKKDYSASPTFCNRSPLSAHSPEYRTAGIRSPAGEKEMLNTGASVASSIDKLQKCMDSPSPHKSPD